MVSFFESMRSPWRWFLTPVIGGPLSVLIAVQAAPSLSRDNGLTSLPC